MKNKNFLILIFGMAIVVAVLVLFSGNCNKVDKPVVVPVKEQEKHVIKIEVESKVKTDSLIFIIKKLSNDTAKLIGKLKFLQGENKRIVGLINRNDVILQAQPENDYMEQSGYISELIANSQQSNSVCNETINNLQVQISTGNDLVKQKDSMYAELRKVLKNGFEQQRILSDFTKRLERKAKWGRVEKFAWKGAALVGGLFILKSAIK